MAPNWLITWSPCYVIVLSRWRSASKIKTIKLTMELLAWVCHSDLLLAQRWENQHLSDAPTVWTPRQFGRVLRVIHFPKSLFRNWCENLTDNRWENNSFIELAECVRGAPDTCSIDADAREVGDAKMSFTAHSYSTPSCAKQLRDVRLKISKILLGWLMYAYTYVKYSILSTLWSSSC